MTLTSKPRPSALPCVQQDSSALLSTTATLPTSLLPSSAGSLLLTVVPLRSSSSQAPSVDLHLHLTTVTHRDASIAKPSRSHENPAASQCTRGTRSLWQAAKLLQQSLDTPRTTHILLPALWRLKSSKTHSRSQRSQ